MTKRFDALLFDAGGIFLLPDPISLGAIVHEYGGNGSIAAMTRAHYAGMAIEQVLPHGQAREHPPALWLIGELAAN